MHSFGLTCWNNKGSSCASAGAQIESAQGAVGREMIDAAYRVALGTYSNLESAGVAPDEALLVLPLATLVRFSWETTAEGLTESLRRGLSPEACWATRLYAEAMLELLESRAADALHAASHAEISAA